MAMLGGRNIAIIITITIITIITIYCPASCTFVLPRTPDDGPWLGIEMLMTIDEIMALGEEGDSILSEISRRLRS